MDFEGLTDRQLASYVRQMNQRPRGVPHLPDSGGGLLAPTRCTYDVNSPGPRAGAFPAQARSAAGPNTQAEIGVVSPDTPRTPAHAVLEQRGGEWRQDVPIPWRGNELPVSGRGDPQCERCQHASHVSLVFVAWLS